jgi:glycosyltransferase involved in cell wall biosynthesis
MSTCLYLLTRPHPDIRARFKTLLHFGQGVYAAHLVRRRTFQELHAHFADRAATIAIVASRLLDKTYSLSIHAGADIFVRPVLLREKIIEARHVATCTEHNRTHIESIVGATVARKITPIRHGLDVQLYGAGAGTAASIPVILSVGQLTDRKGFAHLVAACGSLRDRGYRFECRIVGRGPQREQLDEMITRAQLHDVVTLCGALSHEAVVEEYRRATMFVLPCIRTSDGDVDGVPNVLAEAMASQLPVVSTDLPAIREFVTDGTSGVLVKSGDVESLVDAIAGLLDDPARRAELGKNGRAAVLRDFDADTNVRHFAETLWPDQFAPERALQEDGRR